MTATCICRFVKRTAFFFPCCLFNAIPWIVRFHWLWLSFSISISATVLLTVLFKFFCLLYRRGKAFIIFEHTVTNISCSLRFLYLLAPLSFSMHLQISLLQKAHPTFWALGQTIWGNLLYLDTLLLLIFFTLRTDAVVFFFSTKGGFWFLFSRSKCVRAPVSTEQFDQRLSIYPFFSVVEGPNPVCSCAMISQHSRLVL